MKKSFFILMLMMLMSTVINAQSLTGKQWCTKLADEDGRDVAVALTFEKNGTCELIIATDYEMKEDGVPINIVGGVTVPGTYTHKDKDLTININKGKAVVEVDYEIKGLDAKTKAELDKQIGAEINSLKKEFKDVLLNGMPKMNKTKIVSLENKRLVIKDDDGDEIPFYAE